MGRFLGFDVVICYTILIMNDTYAAEVDASADPRGKVLMQWTFAEIEHHQRSLSWYIISSVIAIALIVYAVLDSNYLFVLMIILLAFIYYTQYQNTPLQIPFVIFQNGIQVGDSFFLYREIQDFAIVYEPPAVKRLYLHIKNRVLRNEISIPLLEHNPLKVRKLLLDFLSENLEMEKESGTDAASRVLKL